MGIPGLKGETWGTRQLYRSFSAKGNPTLKTTLAVTEAGVRLTAETEEAA